MVSWIKGGHLSAEHKKKISESSKGKHYSSETEFKKGHSFSEETLEKIRKAKQGKHCSPETEFKKGIHPETEFKKGNHPKTEFKKGQFVGAKSPLWEGGISFEPYSTDWRSDLKEAIRKRDDYICQICDIRQDELKGRTKKLDVHHIDYNKDNLNPNNLVSLCHSCHIGTNTNREYWIKYFQGGKKNE